MAMAVKSKQMAEQTSFSAFWLLYFLLTIGLIGAVLAYGVCAPLYLLGRVLPVAKTWADRCLCRGISLLMKVQPWLNAEIHLSELCGCEGRGRLLVSNHRSHLDAFVLLSRVPGIRILAKRSLFSIPFLGLMMRLTEQIPVERGRVEGFFAAMDAVRDRLRKSQTVHIFPEMTRCAPGYSGTLGFSSAPFALALQEGCPVVPIVFRGTDGVWPKGKFGLSFRQPLQVLALPPIDPREFASADALRTEAKHRIDEALR